MVQSGEGPSTHTHTRTHTHTHAQERDGGNDNAPPPAFIRSWGASPSPSPSSSPSSFLGGSSLPRQAANGTGDASSRCLLYSPPTEASRLGNSASGRIQEYWVKEPSGFAASRRYKGVLWTHEDRDTAPILYGVVGATGEVVARMRLEVRRYGEADWEDIAHAACPDGSGDACLWIADSGNVRRDRETFFVHVSERKREEKAKQRTRTRTRTRTRMCMQRAPLSLLPLSLFHSI